MTKTEQPKCRPASTTVLAPSKAVAVKSTPAADLALLLSDLRTLVESARQRLASVANSTFTLLCWQVGRRLLRDELQSGRAVYGKQILATV